MSDFNDGCYSCDAGTQLLSKVIAGQCQMHYTRAAVGSGKIPTGKTPQTMTEPAGYVMDAAITNVSVPADGQCQVTVQLDSKNVESEFLATCILLYASDTDNGEVPYTYLVLENNPEWIKSADSDMAKLAVFDLVTAVGSIENVSADTAPDAVVTRAEMDDIAAQKVDKIPGMGLSSQDFTAAEKNKLSTIESGAQANTLTGIKGDAESSYRTGDVNITPANIGAAALEHTHLYAGSSSVSGAANSAVKLQTARSITLNGGLQGSASFDGSSNSVIDGSLKRCLIYDNSTDFANYSWHKFAETTITRAYTAASITFLVSQTHSNAAMASGILSAFVNTEDDKNIYSNAHLEWLIAGSGINCADFVLVYTNKPFSNSKIELWCRHTEQNQGWSFTVLKEHSRTAYVKDWSLFDASGHGSANYTSGSGTVVSSLAPIRNPAAST